MVTICLSYGCCEMSKYMGVPTPRAPKFSSQFLADLIVFEWEINGDRGYLNFEIPISSCWMLGHFCLRILRFLGGWIAARCCVCIYIYMYVPGF